MNFDNIPVVAYGYENTRPTERAALMMVKLENASDQYPDLAVPLVRLSDVRAELSRQASQNRVCGYLVADGELCRKCGKRHAAAQSQPLVEPTAARVSFLLEQKSVLPHWENLMAYQSEDSARKALPVFRKTTSRDIRIVRQTREVVAVDSVAASPPQHQVKKGEPS